MLTKSRRSQSPWVSPASRFWCVNGSVLLLGAMSLLLITGWKSSTLARDGFNHSNAALVVQRPVVLPSHMPVQHSLEISNNLRFKRLVHNQVGLPATIWPYAPFVDTSATQPAQDEDQSPAQQPQVIILSSGQQPESDYAAQQLPSDFSYVRGCRAIPNGYHCDNPSADLSP